MSGAARRAAEPAKPGHAADRVRPNELLGGTHFNECARRTRRRYRLAVLAKALDVKLDRLADELAYLGLALGSGDTPRKIRDVRAKTGFALFDDHEVLHGLLLCRAA